MLCRVPCGKTLLMTYNDIPFDIVDDVVLVDDASKIPLSRSGKSSG